MSVEERLDEVRARIESAGRAADSVTVVGVTKGFDTRTVQAAVGAGIADLGENYAQELLRKAPDAPAGVRWHFLGTVQRNKVAAIARYVHLWQGVDRLAAGEAIARRAPGASVLVQVNVTGAPARNGAAEAEVPALVDALRSFDLDVRGLMAVASVGPGAAEEFRRVARLRAELGLHELSIGMTDDLELAVEAGSTMVRIGRGLFGARPGAGDVRR